MNRWSETFSFGSHFQQSKSSRYTGRRRRGPHRHTATASATAAPSAGTCQPHDVRTRPAQLWLGRFWLLCSVYMSGGS